MKPSNLKHLSRNLKSASKFLVEVILIVGGVWAVRLAGCFWDFLSWPPLTVCFWDFLRGPRTLIEMLGLVANRCQAMARQDMSLGFRGLKLKELSC